MQIKINCWKKDPSQMPEKFKGKKTRKVGPAVEEEHLLFLVFMCDHDFILVSASICMQMDIQEAYL
jgi:hypothetical protein